MPEDDDGGAAAGRKSCLSGTGRAYEVDLHGIQVQTGGMSASEPRGLPTGARRDDALDLLAVLIAGLLLVLVDMQGTGVPRVVLALGFAFFVPGRAIVTNWPRMTRWSGAAMPIVLSLAVITFVATIALWVHFWHPLPIFQLEAWLSIAALGVSIARRHRRSLDFSLCKGNFDHAKASNSDKLDSLDNLVSQVARTGFSAY